MNENIEKKYPTKIILDDNNKIIISYDIVDENEIKLLSSYRLNICNFCEHLEKKDDGFHRCKFCGCNVERKSRLIYSLDENNKAIKATDQDGNYLYVCKLKKW